MSPLRLGTAAALATALMLAGCGGGAKTVTVVNTTTTTATTATRSSATSLTSSAQTRVTSGTLTASFGPPLHLSSFRSPTANIGCMLLGGIARCDIRHRSWQPPPRPASCPHIVDFGQGLEVGGSGQARFVCAGDTAADPSAPALAYNRTTVSGGFRCTSRSDGMTCLNIATGHGFVIAAQSYRVF